MITWQVARHRVSIAGRVSDAETGKPMSGVDIALVEMPQEFKRRVEGRALQHGKEWDSMVERLDKTRTRPDGLFYFVDLPSGDYTVSASLASSGRRYGTGQQSATLPRGADGTVARAFVEIELRPTTVKGKITGAGREGGVTMAEIRVKGSGERAFSSAQGEYVLNCVEPGTRTVQVLAQGYEPLLKTVMLQAPGSVETVNFALEKEIGSANFVRSGTAKPRNPEAARIEPKKGR